MVLLLHGACALDLEMRLRYWQMVIPVPYCWKDPEQDNLVEVHILCSK